MCPNCGAIYDACPIAWATADYIANKLIRFIEEEIVLPFGPLRRIVSDNSTASMAGSVQEKTKWKDVYWKEVTPYAQIANSHSEKMLGTIRNALKNSFLIGLRDLADALLKVLYGCRLIDRYDAPSPF